MTEAQLELLRDKYVLWERASRQGPMDSRDYNARCAEALKAALCIVAEDAATMKALGLPAADTSTGIVQARDDQKTSIPLPQSGGAK